MGNRCRHPAIITITKLFFNFLNIRRFFLLKICFTLEKMFAHNFEITSSCGIEIDGAVLRRKIRHPWHRYYAARTAEIKRSLFDCKSLSPITSCVRSVTGRSPGEAAARRGGTRRRWYCTRRRHREYVPLQPQHTIISLVVATVPRRRRAAAAEATRLSSSARSARSAVKGDPSRPVTCRSNGRRSLADTRRI